MIKLRRFRSAWRRFYRRQLYVPFNAMRGKEPVIIYTMGKVGSTSLYESLPDNVFWVQIHTLNPQEWEQARQSRSEQDVSQVLRHAAQVRRYILDAGRKAKYITVVREPLSRNISAYGALWDFVKSNQLKPQSAHLAIWHQAAEVVENEVAEAAVEIDRSVPSSESVQVYTLPETQVVSYVHEGDFADFQIGHPILLKWVEENGYRVAGAYREIYLKHDPTNMSDTTTEIQYPVVKA